MHKATKIKIGLQIALLLVCVLAVANIPALPVKPPIVWVGWFALLMFAAGLFFGLGLSHFFPRFSEGDNW